MPAEKSAKPPKSAPGPATQAPAPPPPPTPTPPHKAPPPPASKDACAARKARKQKPRPRPDGTSRQDRQSRAREKYCRANQSRCGQTRQTLAQKQTPHPPQNPPPPAATAAATTAAATRTPPAKRDPKPKLAGNQSADPGSTVVAPARSDDT